MAKIIGVKFKNTAKTYYFSPANDKDEYLEGCGVVVETAKGLEFGTVSLTKREIPDEELKHPLKPIIRKATSGDLKRVEDNKKKIPGVLETANKKIAELNLDMKLIGAEYAFDGKKLTLFFSSEDRVDFRELVKALANSFKVRIELRQIGIRDETKLLGGIAPCGRTCCCASCMNDFGKVTIKMAKNQGLHLNPSKISGLCGRLMCCLEYENDYYAEACKKMPKLGSAVATPEGEGIVITNDMLKYMVKVRIVKPDGGEVYKDFPVSELKFKKAMSGKNADKDEDEE